MYTTRKAPSKRETPNMFNMFKDMQKFGSSHNCRLLYDPTLLVVYKIKRNNHSETCIHFIYNFRKSENHGYHDRT